MWEDPIVAEIHRTREKIATEYNFDVAAFFDDLRKRQVTQGDRLVQQVHHAKSLNSPKNLNDKALS